MITGRDVVLGVLPLFHVYGLNAVLGQVLRQHARMVLVDGFDAEGSLDLIEDEAISVVPVAPPVFAYWMQVPGLEDRLGPVRLVLSGSAPLDPDLTDAFSARTRVAIHQGYGLTEAAPVVTSTLCSAVPDPRSVGAPLPGIEVRLVDDPGAPRPTRTPARSTSAATTCSPATGPTAPTGPTPTAGGRPATSATSTPAVTSTWSTGSRSW